MDSITASHHAVRREADNLQATDGHRRFRRRRFVAHSPGDERIIVRAVARAREGDEDGIRLLYLRYADRVYSHVCTIVHDEHAAEDITQTVFARLERKLQTYKPRVVPFGAWITRVAHNAAIDHIRAQRQIPCEAVRDPDTAAEDLGRERLESLRAALAALPADQREVLVLRFVLGLGAGEIAERMGRTENAVHALQHRGRRKLQAELVRLEAAPAAAGA
jgi:RNA polymerase sigma-70 factor (ECF subfamily)